jgi:alkylation response protein AidB-like acyl-CoA dehydrogenase
MDFELSPGEAAFRDEVRDFVRARLPADIRAKVLGHRRLDKADHLRWQDLLAARGWLVGHWPREFGGQGWDPVRVHLFDEQCALAGAPRLIPFGIFMVAPVLMAYGSDGQKSRYLPRIRDNLDWWCQGYSEPGAGSDLASLQCRAVRRGDEYVVDGQKTWTTLAQHADMMFCLVRTATGARRQDGITFLLIDMKTPGITVRPIVTVNGEHEVNEVYFDDVRVPVANRVGEEGRGWTCAKYLLGHERTNLANVGGAKRELARLREIAAQERKGGRPLAEDRCFAARLAWIEIELMALETTLLRVATSRGETPGPEASILKIKGTEILQAIAELMLEAVGPYAQAFNPEAMVTPGAGLGPEYAEVMSAHYFISRKISIYGGSNEIQRNIIAQRVLGL